ncbi:zinc finger C2HC domain-containing protein 1A-like [Acanthaster planci]|uniref:Zinc finger C2HC domain-containing protein 1A-like n=1 Tax=Acanthaster planci TaxID=133434 RepID=A0A8B8A2Q5_ACAPL|nr:zinc finger C2HC domain-containing protein 1A-like [Acanthaster planci]
MEYAAFSSSGNFELQPCSVCGRKFNPDTLGKHENICQKSQLKNGQRKVFNSAKQRLQGTGASFKNRSCPGEVQSQPVKDTHWRERHLEFVNSIRSARAAQRAIKTGGPLPPPPPPSHNPNYIGCPHCSRRFNPTAAERHIPFCAQRTKAHGAPIKPLHKRAAADVSYSSAGVRKAYDNQVVRRKGSANPYAYSQPATDEFPNMAIYSATYGGTRGPATFYRQEFKSAQASTAQRHSGYTSQPPSPPKTTQASSHQSATRSALSSGRSRAARPKSSVRFSDKVDVETFQANGGDTLPSPRPPSHPPPVQPGTNGPASYHSNLSNYRTTKASEMRLQRAQTAGNVGLGSSPRQQPVEVVGTGRPLNSTFTWREKNSPSFETVTKLDSPGGLKTGSHTSLQNGSFSPPSPSGSSPREFTRGSPSLSNSPLSFTPPLRGGGHTPSPLASPVNCTTPAAGLTDVSARHGAKLEAVNGSVPAPFCFQCGTQYPVQDARFCCGCGMRRAFLTPNSLS